METIDVKTWEEFEGELAKRNITGGGEYLFRGQRNSCWELDTSLERKGKRNMPFAEYYRLAEVVRTEIETFTERRWGTLPEYIPNLWNKYEELDKILNGPFLGILAVSQASWISFSSSRLDLHTVRCRIFFL